MLEEIKRTIVFLGHDRSISKSKNEDNFIGTGFLLNIETFFFLGTAKHVIYDKQKGEFRKGMWSAVRLKTGKYKKIYIDSIKEKYNVEWLVHSTKKYDIAVLPIELDLENDDLKTIPKNIFFGDSESKKPDELSQLVFLSYQPGVEKVTNINPVLRTAFVARKNIDKTILIDANTFPGNSGSPVFMAPTVGYVDKNNQVQFGNPTSGKFVGVISGYIPYRELAISPQTGQARIIFEENTGLAIVHTHEILDEIFESKQGRNMIKKLRAITNGTK